MSLEKVFNRLSLNQRGLTLDCLIRVHE